MIAKIDEMKSLVEEMDIAPYNGANEACFESFSKWYNICKDRSAGISLVSKFDVESILGFFDSDLREYWKETE